MKWNVILKIIPDWLINRFVYLLFFYLFIEENDDDSYVELTHRKFRRGFLKVHNPHAEEIFAHYKNQVQDYDESIQNSILTEGMSVKHKYPIRNKRNAGAKISFCCQRTRSPPCEIYFCHDDW